MPLDSSSVWSNAFNNLPKTADASWAANMANEVNSLTSNKLNIVGISPPSVFVFGVAAFQAALVVLTPVPSSAAGAANFAAAWESGMLASTMTVSAGAALGAPSPATIWSAPPTTVIDPASIAASKAALISAITAIPPGPDANAFAAAFRAAFLAITCTVTGINSVSPPAGPQPLVSPLTAVN